MAPHIEEMRKNVAETLGIDISQVNIKATTEEGLGFTGTGEGISSQAVTILESIRDMSFLAASSEEGCQGCGSCPRQQETRQRQ